MISATVLHDVAAATSKEAFFASAAAAAGVRGVFVAVMVGVSKGWVLESVLVLRFDEWSVSSSTAE